MKDFYSIKQFADLLGLHHNTIRRGIKFGRISAFRVGQGKKASFRIAHSEIQRMAILDLPEEYLKSRAEENKNHS